MKKQDILDQVLAIRATGRENMFSTAGVQRVAMDLGYYSLVLWIEEHKKLYCNLILTGQLDWDDEEADAE